MKNIYLAIVLAPLFGAVMAGLFGRQIGRAGAHVVTIAGVAVSTVLSLYALRTLMQAKAAGLEYVFNETLYTWLVTDGFSFHVGFLVDELTVVMMSVVTFVSLMVHIYTIGYMKDDPGYQRFFSYISLFTFAMLTLVMANNLLQLFFGWEGVGVVSYLLIGFWFKRETAIYANLKAFLVNRVGDAAMVIGIAGVFFVFGSLDYAQIFPRVGELNGLAIEVFEGQPWSMATLISISLFIGAMAKSAQFPLHVWLPDSMEGPTPISALIHAATMVTAGIFLLARMSPVFELSETALSMVLIIGAITAFFMGLLGLVQNDIKRVVAYSTLSQLGYMTVALGASAYSAAIFHLMTHAFFKALLFLGAGSVIIAMHHEQDMRKMGGIGRYMPITYLTALVGSLALVGFPGFAGFFSKDAIIEAVKVSHLPGAGLAYWAVLSGVLVTALYSFRMFFMVFHGKPRMDEQTRSHLHETPLVVTVPLLLLAIPSVVIGWIAIEPMLFSGFFGQSIHVDHHHDVLAHLADHFHGAQAFALHGFTQPPFWLMLTGIVAAWVLFLKKPEWAAALKSRLSPVHQLLDNKYYLDDFNALVFAGGLRGMGRTLWQLGDRVLIDGLLVNGSARLVGWSARVVRHLQTGYLYHYAFVMIIGLVGLAWMARSAAL
ncbi:MAG: NADH-quinone oxidoreductase subunit L [Gammaproteobacteria bacterium]|nr:NADH-quinone oxidoreductase subunit L [Gammaproteobacteria bacterium]